jgi:hypothetical protein
MTPDTSYLKLLTYPQMELALLFCDEYFRSAEPAQLTAFPTGSSPVVGNAIQLQLGYVPPGQYVVYYGPEQQVKFATFEDMVVYLREKFSLVAHVASAGSSAGKFN